MALAERRHLPIVSLVRRVVVLFFDQYCPEHGWLSHTVVHEAAHAAAAIDRGIPFREVRIVPPNEWAAAHGDGTIAGAVWLHEGSARTWARADPASALELALAGYLAETGAWGHHLPESYTGDVKMWRIGVGLVDETSLEEIEATLGCTFAEVKRNTRRWLSANSAVVLAVAAALARVEHQTGSLRAVDYSNDLRLTEQEVRDVVTATRGR